MIPNRDRLNAPLVDRSTLLERQLDTLFHVSHVLSRSLDLARTLSGLLEVLHDRGGMRHGMVALLEPQSNELMLAAIHDNGIAAKSVRYRQGEGVVGAILKHNATVVIPRLANEPRFLDRLGVYDLEMPFIGVPIRTGADGPVGVLAAQPDTTAEELLADHTRHMEMVANLVAQSVRLSRKVEEERQDLTDERDQLRRTVRKRYSFGNMIGHTSGMQRIFELVRQVAKWNTTVLVRGESGTGKELIANAIHYNSPRANSPFVRLNCAALPDNLLESELFGHEKGAFTGATSQRKGRFEQADGGTLFLDEIPGQAAACPAGGGVRTGRRQSDTPGRCAGDRRHQPQSGGGGGEWKVS
jgi:Nif-specific regulatory protein